MLNHFLHDESALDKVILEMIEITENVLAGRGVTAKVSPCCQGPSVEIYSTARPVGYTGIWKCLACDTAYDPNFVGVE